MREKICLISLGCSKNLVDSEVMLGCLQKEGYQICSDKEEGDIIIVNTCAFINEAKKESIETILELSELKKNGKCSVLVVSGCLSQRYGEELKKEIPEVDLFIGTENFSQIGKILKKKKYSSPSFGNVLVKKPNFILDSQTPRVLSTPFYTAYVKIAEGCSNHCTYCIIPQLRGSFRSRTIESIVTEVKNLAAAGVKEINIISQDTTLYGSDLEGNISLATLLKDLVEITGIEWIRLLYCHPDHIFNDLIEIIKEERICKYIDLPIQHISNNILKRMGRKEGGAEIRDIIRRLREEIPGLNLRTTVMVGFPGETKDDFNELVEFIKEAKFEHLGTFKYSKEEGTPAFNFKGSVAEKTKEKRYHRLMEVQSQISRQKNQDKIGSKIKAIVTGVNDNNIMIGRAYFQAPDIDGIIFITRGSAKVGAIVRVKVTGAHEYDLEGEIIGAD